MGKKSNRPEYKGCNDEFKELAYKVEKMGYTCRRGKGSHFVFTNRKGEEISANSNLNAMVSRRLQKQIGIL